MPNAQAESITQRASKLRKPLNIEYFHTRCRHIALTQNSHLGRFRVKAGLSLWETVHGL
jgi:hypothetical protein